MEEIKKITIALELLDSALVHYYDTQQYFSAIQCAGAAEEILGRYVTHYEGESAFERLSLATRRVSRLLNGEESSKKSISYIMNFAKNSTKHMNNIDDETIIIDSKDEANDLLSRAVENYYYLMQYIKLKETKNIQRFNHERT
ncbi:MAG: hypothetical protein COB23_07040 [Methylophaga sp.]|nr:MAG: hypothetical protein COB23_07040 [Methylophaga sp.]